MIQLHILATRGTPPMAAQITSLFFAAALGLEIAAHAGKVPSIYDTFDLLEEAIPELRE